MKVDYFFNVEVFVAGTTETSPSRGWAKTPRRAGLFLTTRRLLTSARTMAQPFETCAPGSSGFAGLWSISPRGKSAGDEIMYKDAAADDRGPEHDLVAESF